MTVPLPAKTTGIQIEITARCMKVQASGDGLDLPLDRSHGGHLTPECKARVIAALKPFVEKLGALSRERASCAVDARGVLIRVLDLPTVVGQEFDRLLLLQIEREFPLPPGQMAWGSQKARQIAPRNGSPGSQRVVVIAARKELMHEYRDLLQECGLHATFTAAALARAALVPAVDHAFAVLNVSDAAWEFVAFEHDAPKSLRSISLEAAPLRSARPPLGQTESDNVAAVGALSTSALAPARIESLKTAIGESAAGTVYITGDSPQLEETAAAIKAQLLPTPCEVLVCPAGAGRSATTLGLAKMAEQDGGRMIVLDVDRRVEVQKPATPPTRRWAIVAVVLFILCFLARYAEPLFQTPRLTRRLAELKQYRDSLPNVDRDLAFLQFIQTNQPKYIEILSVMAEAAPPGTRIESLSLKRSGDFSLRGSMRDGLQVGDFRSKLIKSEAFASVVVEEQAPTPDRQKVNIRIGGDWKPSAEPKPISPASTAPGARTSSRRDSTNTSVPGATNAAPAPIPPSTNS